MCSFEKISYVNPIKKRPGNRNRYILYHYSAKSRHRQSPAMPALLLLRNMLSIPAAAYTALRL